MSFALAGNILADLTAHDVVRIRLIGMIGVLAVGLTAGYLASNRFGLPQNLARRVMLVCLVFFGLVYLVDEFRRWSKARFVECFFERRQQSSVNSLPVAKAYFDFGRMNVYIKIPRIEGQEDERQWIFTWFNKPSKSFPECVT